MDLSDVKSRLRDVWRFRWDAEASLRQLRQALDSEVSQEAKRLAERLDDLEYKIISTIEAHRFEVVVNPRTRTMHDPACSRKPWAGWGDPEKMTLEEALKGGYDTCTYCYRLINGKLPHRAA